MLPFPFDEEVLLGALAAAYATRIRFAALE
jgi:hypothetical protein